MNYVLNILRSKISLKTLIKYITLENLFIFHSLYINRGKLMTRYWKTIFKLKTLLKIVGYHWEFTLRKQTKDFAFTKSFLADVVTNLTYGSYKTKMFTVYSGVVQLLFTLLLLYIYNI